MVKLESNNRSGMAQGLSVTNEVLLTNGRLFVALDSDSRKFLGELRTSEHIEYLRSICKELRVVVDFLRSHKRWTKAVPLHTLDVEHISQCAKGAQELSNAVRQACQVKTVRN